MGTVTPINKNTLKTFNVVIESTRTHVIHVQVQAYDYTEAENMACNKVDDMFDSNSVLNETEVSSTLSTCPLNKAPEDIKYLADDDPNIVIAHSEGDPTNKYGADECTEYS